MELIKDYRETIKDTIAMIDSGLVLGTPQTLESYRFKVGYRAGLVRADEILSDLLEQAAGELY